MGTRIGKHGECHPCGNLAALLAAAEMRKRSGAEFLTAFAVSYQILARLSEATSVVNRGFDHTLSLTFSVAAGVSRLLGLDLQGTKRALAVAGADAPGSTATRTEPISNWKGLASAECACRATFCALLAAEGIDGPPLLFEGPQGLTQMAGDEFQVVWSQEGLDVVERVLVKKHNSEARSQSAVDALVTLRREDGLSGADVERVEIETSKSGFDNLGGGRYGPKDSLTRKEQADHNLRYIAAVALIDGELWPAQYAQARIEAPDVQALLQRVEVKPNDAFTNAEPDAQGTRVTIVTRDERTLVREENDYEGFPTRPMSWDAVEAKFRRLAEPHAESSALEEIVEAVKGLESASVTGLTALLARAIFSK